MSAAPRRRILVALSGGVDSSVAAALLVEAGHEVIGATMKTFCYGDEESAGASRTCCGLDGIRDARAVADALGIPHYTFDVESEFTRDVIDDFVAEYSRGRTPNPCVRCNSNTKFHDLMRRGRALACDGIASGHYARIERIGGTVYLQRARDRQKDQSYFLWGLPRELLETLHFPLGDLAKAQVRERARALGLVTAAKPESQEICFVPHGNYRDFLAKRLLPLHPALSPGPIVDVEGRVLGRHDGYAGFTVGQRRGLGGGFPEARFVIEIRPATREVVIGPRHLLEANGVELEDLNWIADPPAPGTALEVQIRYRAPALRCRFEGETAGVARLTFAESARAVTPGQSGVLFAGDRLLGGGRIRRVTSADRPPRRTPRASASDRSSAIPELQPSPARTDLPASPRD